MPNLPIYCCYTDLVSLVMRYNNNAFILCANIDINKLKISGFHEFIFYLMQWFKKFHYLVPGMFSIRKSLVLTDD